MVAQNIFFYAIAATMVGAAVVVVTSRNVVHSALALIVVFGGVAAQFVILAAEFVAVTQVLVYIGAIMVLMLFGIMLTRAKIGRDPDMTNDHWWVGIITAVLLVGVMGYALIDYFGDDPLPADRRIATVNAVDGANTGSNTATVSDAIFSQYLIPFEVISVLLLAALVGAIVIARKDR
jgi:NADH-quinone oxidoreductase subunit J